MSQEVDITFPLAAAARWCIERVISSAGEVEPFEIGALRVPVPSSRLYRAPTAPAFVARVLNDVYMMLDNVLMRRNEDRSSCVEFERGSRIVPVQSMRMIMR